MGSGVIMLLILFTLLAALGVGFYQLYSVERAKQQGSTTPFANRPGPGGTTTPTS